MIAHDVLELIFQRKNLSKILNTFYVQNKIYCLMYLGGNKPKVNKKQILFKICSRANLLGIENKFFHTEMIQFSNRHILIPWRIIQKQKFKKKRFILL